MGTYCNEGCLPGWYGNDCASQCICENNSTCDTKDGTCTCKEATCGKYCDSKCECYEEQHFVCEETTGLCRCEGSRFQADSTGYSFDIFLFAVIGIASAAIALFACLVCLAHGLRRHRQGFKTIVDTEFDSYVEELLREHPDLEEWILKRKDIKVQKEIGFGEFGRIELAELQRRDGTVTAALKSLMTKLRHYLPISYRDFCHEIACLKKLQGHPNIIYLLGIVVSGDPKYIIVEYAARGDLLNYVRELRNRGITRPEEERLLGMARDITLALQHMEENKFIHRDIACRNVLIMEDYVAKIGDFGLSRDIYETGQYCKDLWSPIHGPLPLKWTPPEFLQGGVYDTKGDIWSYGVLLWEIATLGETPFTNVPTSEMTTFFLDRQRLYQSERCTNSLYNIMLRCWQLKPIARPNARELTNELEELSRLYERFFNDIVPEQFEIEDW
ncbi:insulin-like growth factor 1 receptor isoform X1 [Ptychodera flava]|uniref:insulin-like growth factor 1 receptor isoform X1 n=1 Tax=Ptychodera flava TaxID=63121 RepID=UPI003969C0B1